MLISEARAIYFARNGSRDVRFTVQLFALISLLTIQNMSSLARDDGAYKSVEDTELFDKLGLFSQHAARGDSSRAIDSCNLGVLLPSLRRLVRQDLAQTAVQHFRNCSIGDWDVQSQHPKMFHGE